MACASVSTAPAYRSCPICKAALAAGKRDQCVGGHRWWAPNRGPQERFLKSRVRELLYGGAAGGGKSAAAIMIPLRWVHLSLFTGLVLRRETTDLGPLLKLAERWYPLRGGVSKHLGAGCLWTFPSGATVRFGHCKNESDAHGFDGDEFQLIIFDELVQFTQTQFQNVCARLRGSYEGGPRQIRCMTNPPDVGQGDWVFQWWGAWMDPDFRAIGLPKRPGKPPLEPHELAWICKTSDGKQEVYILSESVANDWNANPERSTGGDNGFGDQNYAISRGFIPALAQDNPFLMENDPMYIRQLGNLGEVRRKQLADGNWLVRAAPGDYFKRPWFPVVPMAPRKCVRIRFWDRAATAEYDGSEPDWTVGVKLAMDPDGIVYVEDVIRMRGNPGEVQDVIKQTAQIDGLEVKCLLSMDPGQSGKVEAWHLSVHLRGCNFDFVREVGDKRVRASPFSAYARSKNVRMCEGDWNRVYLDEMEAFPTGKFDDQVDASSGAFFLMADGGGGGESGFVPVVVTRPDGGSLG